MSDADPINLLPLDHWHRAHGARMVEFAGYSMPLQYDGIIAEHLWTREQAGLFDVSHMGQIELCGAARDVSLETIVPSDVSALTPGRMRYSLLLNHAGGIIDDMMITNAGEYLYLVVNGAVKAGDIAYLRANLFPDVTVKVRDAALLALQGPKAAAALSRLEITSAASDDKTPADLFFMESAAFEWNAVPLLISRSGYTGEDGFEISLPAEQAEPFADALCAHPEVKPIGLGARDSLRLEAGLPLYGHDLDDEITPVTADLAFAISKRRRAGGGFAGSDIILNELAAGATTQRVGFTLAGRQPAREGAIIYHGDTRIGHVTSGGFSPTCEMPVGMGYVAADYTTPGQTFEIEVRGKRLIATVAAMPFTPHRYHRKGTMR